MEMSTQQVEQRIASAVMRLVQQSGRKTVEGVEIDFPITRQDLAEMTGSTLHTVSRLMSAWEEAGIVRSGRQRVTVTDPHALMLVAENRRKR
jgi:CRP-like cAMP-binding protein